MSAAMQHSAGSTNHMSWCSGNTAIVQDMLLARMAAAMLTAAPAFQACTNLQGANLQVLRSGQRIIWCQIYAVGQTCSLQCVRSC